MNTWRCMAKTFVPPPPLDRAGWEADRHLKLGKKGDIVVDISELETTVEGDKATMRFRQRYSSSNYRDETRKTFGWALEAGVWKIVSEEAEAGEVGAARRDFFGSRGRT